ncbi:MAG: sigma-54-dependent Fis family transcriptional regulator [Bacteriovoracaceae bacterium]|nr:sigma-54-dependent Fis family transcriptional regulator [Bacteriovoracaceae bacterium]
MINWKNIGDLHAIKKLEEVIGKWFGIELFFTDEHGKIQSDLLDKEKKFRNDFFKIQMGSTYGYDLVMQDIGTVLEKMENSADKKFVFDSSFKGVKGIAASISLDGQLLGSVFAYPFLNKTLTSDELTQLKNQIKESGVAASDTELSLKSLKEITGHDQEYLQALVELVADEVLTFHAEIQKREERILELNSEIGSKYRYHSMIGKSKRMQQIYQMLEKISNSETTILIQGDNGTGKELVAKAIHYNSPRKNCVFLAQNCSAFNDNLLDSELFGHVKGAFTGAVKDKKGLFEVANGGTLFLDEIGDTSLTMQVKLLRVLQEGTFLPVGATSPRKVNVRLIAATNKNLKEMVAKGEFREDLYYRINVINVTLPALRERQEDIPLLMEHFLEKKCAEMGIVTKVVSPKALEKLLDYPWPGNVRELENEVERMVVLSGEGKSLVPENLSPKIVEFGEAPSAVQGIRTTGSLKEALEELELLMIREGLKRCNFNKSKLAKELGISRAGLIMKVEKYGLDKRFKKAVGE